MVKRAKGGEGKKAAKVVSTTVVGGGPSMVALSCEDGNVEGRAASIITTTYPALQWSSDSSSSSNSSSNSSNSGSFEHEPKVDEAAKVREAFRQRSLLDEQLAAQNNNLNHHRMMMMHRAESPIIPVVTSSSRQTTRDLLKSVAALHLVQQEQQSSFLEEGEEGTSMTLSSHQLRLHNIKQNNNNNNNNNNHHHLPPSADPEARTSVSGPGGRNFTLRERFQRLSRLQRKKLLLKAADDREQQQQQQHAANGGGAGGSFLLLEDENDHGDHHHHHDHHDGADHDHVETCASTASDDDPREHQRHHHQQSQHHPQHSHRYHSSSRNHTASSSCASDDDGSQALRHQRQANDFNCSMMGNSSTSNMMVHHQSLRSPRKSSNYAIKLHVYDLIAKDTLMMLPPFGCIVEIGKCFNEVNSALHQLGTGAYHVGIEINGIEYAYGATSTPGKTGIFSCIPTLSPGYQYRQTIDLGERPCLVRRAWVAVPRQVPFRGYSSNVYRQVEEYIDGRQVIKEMTKDYMGTDYDILRKNCCSFARDACIRLGVQPDEIPSWFRNLAETGATTQDMAIATVQPLTSVLSACEEEGQMYQIEPEFGFEMIARQNAEGTKSIVVVVDSRPQRRSSNQGQISLYDLRRNATWTY